MSKALFILRHYNDIDHIAPVIHKWSRAGHDSAVILLGRANTVNDYRIKYISSLERVRLIPLTTLLTRPDLIRFRLISLILYAHARRYIDNRIFRVCQSLWPCAGRHQLWENTARLILDKALGTKDKGVVVSGRLGIAWASPVEFMQEILSQAHGRGYATVSLPHEGSPHVSELVREDELLIETGPIPAGGKLFDYVVCPNDLSSQHLPPYLEDSPINVLGSARYSDEWLDVIAELLPPAPMPKKAGELRVVMFLRKREYSLFWDEVERTILMLGQLDVVHLVIKSHPGEHHRQPLRRIIKRVRSRHIELAGDQIHSTSLLAWADVAIDVATPVSFEAVKRGLPVLAAEYLHAGYTALAHYVPETAMHYRDEIYHAIMLLHEDPGRRFYNEEDRQTFIRTMLDVPDKQVLERYVALLEEAAKREIN
jgi:hypothetical protein